MMIHIRSPTALNMPPQDGGKPPGGQDGRQAQSAGQAPCLPVNVRPFLSPPPSVGTGNQGLTALGDPGKDGGGHQSQIGHNPVGRHSHAPRFL